jgi:hypothetical protein
MRIENPHHGSAYADQYEVIDEPTEECYREVYLFWIGELCKDKDVEEDAPRYRENTERNEYEELKRNDIPYELFRNRRILFVTRVSERTG